MSDDVFIQTVRREGAELFRSMPWREDTRPYFVLVSEIMLQQTQVERVIPKFLEFIQHFPSIEALASAPLGEVLRVWSGLGYNRRAQFLHRAAKEVVEQCGGEIPRDAATLVRLPGIGVNTAGALLAYSFNTPAIFVETNIRTVLFHHYFGDDGGVSDVELREIMERTIDRENPREWYWALMDYGAFLKKQGLGANRLSKHYARQPALKGSVREARGLILKQLARGPLTHTELRRLVAVEVVRFERAFEGLLSEGLISKHNNTVRLGS